jgi:hypothetical protein
MGSALDHLDHQEEISQIFHGRFSCPQQSINCHESIINGRFHCVDRLGLLASLLAIRMIKNYCSFYYNSTYKILLENCSIRFNICILQLLSKLWMPEIKEVKTKLDYRVSQIETNKVNWLWKMDILRFSTSYLRWPIQEVMTFGFHQTVFKKVT